MKKKHGNKDNKKSINHIESTEDEPQLEKNSSVELDQGEQPETKSEDGLQPEAEATLPETAIEEMKDSEGLAEEMKDSQGSAEEMKNGAGSEKRGLAVRVKSALKECSLTKRKMRLVLAVGVLAALGVVAFNLGNFKEGEPAVLILIATGILMLLAAAIFAFDLPFLDRRAKLLQRIMLIAAPVVTLIVVEVMQGSQLRPWWYTFWINVALYVGIFLLFYAISNSVRFSVVLPSLLLFILGVGNYYVMFFRSSALQPWDFFAIQTAANVSEGMDYRLGWQILIGGAVLIIVWALTAHCIKDKLPLKARMKNRGKSLIVSVLCLAFVAGNFFLNSSCMNANQWDTVQASRQNGLTANLLFNMKTLINTPPQGYSIASIAAASSQSSSEYALRPEKRAPRKNKKKVEKPNIIVIMNESFSDLSIYGDLQTSEDSMPFIRNMSRNTIKGSLIVPVFGAGTCNSEYDFLTGNSSAMLRPGSYPLKQFVNDVTPSIVSTVKSQGYDTIAIHPYYPNGWNRSRAYPLLGFREFYSMDDFVDPLIYRKYISDESSYQKIIDQFENKGDQPLFVFNVTMQNHLGFDVVYDNFPEPITFPNEELYPKAKQYLSLVKKSDEAIADLIAYFNKQKEPTIIAFFGDHQPAIENAYYEQFTSGSALTASQLELQKHTVPFFIWANYSIDQSKGNIYSVNYLSTLIMETARLELPEYNKYLSGLKETLPVISSSGCVDKNGTIFNYDDEDTPYRSLIDQYHSMQYNSVFGKETRLDRIFFLTDPAGIAVKTEE